MHALSEVLPPSATTNAAGHLEIAGCDLVHLAHEYGTPLFVYDADYLRLRARAYRHAFANDTVDGYAAYASKAFACTALARIIAEEGLWMDVSTAGELAVAEAASFPADRLLMHGNNKSDAELEAVVAAHIGRVVIDSLDEIDRIDAIVRRRGAPPVRALLRLTPGVDADTHEYIRTGQEDSKFGLGIASGLALEAVKRLADIDSIDLYGMHSHIGSQIFDLRGFEEAAEAVVDFAATASEVYGTPLNEFDLGGGLGIAYTAEDAPPAEIEDLANLLWSRISASAAEHGIGAPRIGIEPGRSIVGRAGVTLYTVGVVKNLPGIRTYVAVDGGMSDNMRPSLYDAGYETLLATRPTAERDMEAHIAGKHCETGDVIVENARVPADIRRGDVLVTPATGAYGYAMANNYNLVTRPAVVFASRGDVQVVVRRETHDDLLSLMQ